MKVGSIQVFGKSLEGVTCNGELGNLNFQIL
jgi:hypothetical protein